jgi:Domain of unknown function (DUF4440)
MNRLFRWTALALLCLSGITARAQTAQELREIAAQKEVDRQELENLERETGRAVQLHNGTFFRRVYSDDFIGTINSGQAVNKMKFVNAIEQSPVQYISLVVTDVRVRLYEDTAVVTSLWSWRSSEKGGPQGRQARIMHVYINGPRGWQAVASQETVLPG